MDQGSAQMLEEVGEWMAINGEGIYGSKAWVKLGEGANGRINALSGGKIGSRQANHRFYTSDFRFTVGEDGALYAWCMSVPKAGEKLRISTLGLEQHYLVEKIKKVKILGHKGALKWSQEKDALVITCPETMNLKTAIGFKIELKTTL